MWCCNVVSNLKYMYTYMYDTSHVRSHQPLPLKRYAQTLFCLYLVPRKCYFCQGCLSSYVSLSLPILYSPLELPNVLWERKPSCCDLFVILIFSFYQHIRNYSVKDFSGILCIVRYLPFAKLVQQISDGNERGPGGGGGEGGFVSMCLLSAILVLAGLCRPSVHRRPSVHHFQTSPPQKPRGQSKPNFMWRLHGMVERKFV